MTAAVVSAFAFFAIGVANGEDINQGADFEAAGFVEGEQFNAGLSDDAQSTGDKYWYTEDTEADNVISNHSGAVGAPRPDKFASDANNKFLKVETNGRLWRSVKNNGGSSDFLTNTTEKLNVYGHSIADSAIYLDTLVKFTPADSDFSSDLTEGDKIAISYVEREEERDSNNNVTVEAATNFVIRAGLIVGGQLFQTNYYAYLPDDPSLENFDKDAWHRLTVRTIPDVGDGSVGFVVYVDETNLTYSTSVDAGFGTLDATAQGFYNSEKHALFPSAVGSGAGKLMISAAGLVGGIYVHRMSSGKADTVRVLKPIETGPVYSIRAFDIRAVRSTAKLIAAGFCHITVKMHLQHHGMIRIIPVKRPPAQIYGISVHDLNLVDNTLRIMTIRRYGKGRMNDRADTIIGMRYWPAV